jgi:chlorophyll(ide) b reductase
MNLFQNKNALKTIRGNKPSLNVVITGGSRGLGRSMAEKFHKENHKVITVSRSKINSPWKHIVGDLTTKKTTLDAFDSVLFAANTQLDVWINCAAISDGYDDFVEKNDKDIHDIIYTNLISSSLFLKTAHDVMSQQQSGGDIISVVGAGSNGRGTPKFALYGASKAGIKQMTKTLQQEWKKDKVHLHLLSPGMMSTELLLSNLPSDIENKIKPFVNTAEDVANALVPEVLDVYYDARNNATLNYWTFGRIAKKITG